MNYRLFLFGCLLLCSCSSINPLSKKSLNKILDKRDDWKQVKKGEITIHYIDKSEVSQNIDSVIRQTELGVEKARKFLGEEYNRPINIITVDNKKIINQLIGQEIDGSCFPGSDSAIEVSEASPVCHEKFHLLSINAWGMSKYWINEGTAVACDGVWWGFKLHNLANYLFQQNKIIALSKLTKSNISFGLKDFRFSYPQAGSIIKYIDERYGRVKLLKLWKEGDVQKSLGITINELENEWIDEIKKFSTEGINYLEKIEY